ncbi:hypothetical protein R1T16_17555 [Flavobacterium sp. DG1-102-2]|uniref:hypothetical protein n=1 Tax=Flavobacterium sp. DG1-102-2 TaxID=3081663 RepID=UPI002949085C|nr:hypothetical protein [Flavobacterium sp. DG1-102-2]MDV6170247.1 hypothetical protein [Flavobacterium sp. DG1-102-2]
MKNLKKMILPILLVVSGILEMSLHGFELFAQEVGLPNTAVSYFRFTALIVTVMVTTLSKPPKVNAVTKRKRKPKESAQL